MQNRASDSSKITTGEKLIGVAIGLGTGIVTAVGVVLPTLEFIVGGVGGVTGLGVTVSGLGSILTMALGGVVAFAVGGLAAYMAYKSYVKTAKELKKEIADEEDAENKAEENLRNEIYDYFMAIMRLYMIENPADENIVKNKLDSLVDKHMPAALQKRPLARENLKKLFNMVKEEDSFKSTALAAVNIVGDITGQPNSYSHVLNLLRGIDPATVEANENLRKEQDRIKGAIASFYKLNYNESIRPKRADPSYLIDGLLGGITGFVGVLGISSSITTIAMGLSFSLAFGFLITNPVGWGIIGLAVAAGVAAGVTYGYLQYKNAKRKQIVSAKQEKVSQLTDEAKLINEKTNEINLKSRELNGKKQVMENLQRADLEARNRMKGLSEKIAVASLERENAALKCQVEELKKVSAPVRHQRSMSSSGALGLFGETKATGSKSPVAQPAVAQGLAAIK